MGEAKRRRERGDKRVWLAQCLCPQRHAIMAAAGEAVDREDAEKAVAGPLRERIDHLLGTQAINPWCAICGSQEWHIEVGRTVWNSLEHANAALRQAEAENLAANAVFGDLHRRGRPN